MGKWCRKLFPIYINSINSFFTLRFFFSLALLAGLILQFWWRISVLRINAYIHQIALRENIIPSPLPFLPSETSAKIVRPENYRIKMTFFRGELTWIDLCKENTFNSHLRRSHVVVNHLGTYEKGNHLRRFYLYVYTVAIELLFRGSWSLSFPNPPCPHRPPWLIGWTKMLHLLA